MRTHIVRLIVVALAFVVAAKVFGSNFGVPSQTTGAGHILTYFIDALAFGVLNMTVGVVLRLFTLPFRILTLGLFSIVINAILIVIMKYLPASTHVSISTNFVGALEAAATIAVISALADLVEFTHRHTGGDKKK